MAKSLKNMMGAGIGAGTALLLNGTVVDGLAATGSTQANALVLTNDVNVIGTVASGAGVRLLANPQPGDEILISNMGANTLLVYPAVGATIEGSAVNAPFSLPANATAEFIARIGSANWVVIASSGSIAAPTGAGQLLFNVPAQSGLLALLMEDF